MAKGEDNKRTIEQMYQAFGKGEVDAIVRNLHDDVRWVTHVDKAIPWSGDFSGKSRVPAFFQAIYGSVDVHEFTPREWVIDGDTVVSTGNFGCKVKATGKEASTPWVFIWKFRDGKVASYEQYQTPALAAAFR